MTSLRFTGDVPLWLGLVCAFAVAGMSWRYYNRESFDLPRRLRWLLPLLRSTAFFLGILSLTGPVLHHRTTIGELGRIQIFVDASNSMTLHDRHMPLARKLQIAERLGWLSEGKIDWRPIQSIEAMAAARRDVLARLTNESDPGAEFIESTAAEFLSRLKEAEPYLPPRAAARLLAEIVTPLEKQLADDAASVETVTSLAERCAEIEEESRSEFADSLQERMRSGDDASEAALTQFDEAQRWRRVELGLAGSPGNVLSQLRGRHEVSILQLSGERALPLDLESPADSSTDPPANRQFANLTDLSSPILAYQKATAVAAGSGGSSERPQTAIVLVTDGQHNLGPSPLETARLLGGEGIPIYCVGVGGTNVAADLAITGLEHPELVFAKSRVRGVVILEDSMPEGEPFVVQIGHEDAVFWQRQLLTENSGTRRVEFEFEVDEAVERLESQLSSSIERNLLPLQLTATIAPLSLETETENNSRTMRLAAVLKSDRILILDGRPRWETRYLRNAFERDEQWSVNTVIAGPGTDEPELPRGDRDGTFPRSRDQLFHYDLVIFGEMSPELFGPHELEWLREFVAVRGGGLVFIDGHRGTLRQLDETDLGGLLPITWSASSLASKPDALRLTDRGSAESALRLAADDAPNRRFWTKLPPPHSFIATESLPGAEVLVELEASGQIWPALVTQRVGAGRVLYVAFDETWRWRFKAADRWHQRIWNQLAGFVMPKPFAVSNEFVAIDSGAVSYASGEAADIRIQLLDLDGKPAIDSKAEALIWKDGSVVDTVGLTPHPEVPGQYRGRTPALAAGDYEVSVRAAGYSEAALAPRSTFVVNPPESEELATTSANAVLLNHMADASGGVYLSEEDLGKLPELLDPLSSGRVVESDTLIWQSYIWFTTILLLLTVEWLLRKRAGLL